jgi:hypothetical protein
MKEVKTLQLNKLNAQTKEKIYKRLLSGSYTTQLTIDVGRDKKDLYNIDAEFMNNDCCLSSWSLNFYTRTKKAVKGERYKTLSKCLTAFKRLAKDRRINIVSNLRVYKRVNFKYDDGVKDWYDCHIFSIEL